MTPNSQNPDRVAVRRKWGVAVFAVLAVVSSVAFWSIKSDKAVVSISVDGKSEGRSTELLATGNAMPATPTDGAIVQNTPENKQIAADAVPPVLAQATGPGVTAVPMSPPSSQPVATVIPHTSFVEMPPGGIPREPAKATVIVDGTSVQLEPNEIGSFPRRLIAALTTAAITVVYPNGNAADPLVIQCEDGGVLDNGMVVKRAELDASKAVSFQFKSGVPEGVYRITLRKGTDEKHLEFWVGSEPGFKPTSSTN